MTQASLFGEPAPAMKPEPKPIRDCASVRLTRGRFAGKRLDETPHWYLAKLSAGTSFFARAALAEIERRDFEYSRRDDDARERLVAEFEAARLARLR